MAYGNRSLCLIYMGEDKTLADISNFNIRLTLVVMFFSI